MMSKEAVDVNDNEVFPGAHRSEILEILMSDIVGPYERPGDIPEWSWVEEHASFAHCQNGQFGVWEFVINLNCQLEDIPSRLAPIISKARESQIAYIVFHQGT